MTASLLRALACLLALASIGYAQVPQPEAASPVEHVISFEAPDGVALEAKLSLPAERTGLVPVVFYLHGAGPRTYDNPFPYAAEDGSIRTGKYLDFFANELTRRGIAFFRMSKRGCRATAEPPSMQIDREVFAGATHSVLLGDYQVALDLLREREDVDSKRIVLVGASEGTRLAPLLAKRSPKGILGIAMLGYAADNCHDTIVWQSTIGPWRNIAHLIPAARDGELTKEEHASFVEASPGLAAQLPFQPVDIDGDGRWTSADFEQLNAPRLQAILKAVEEKDDDLLWTNLLNLSSAYCREWWKAEPNSATLLQLEIPLAIFHGELDGTCRVEGVRETRAAFESAGRSNLQVFLYPDGNHDLNWAPGLEGERAPAPFRDLFALVVQWTKPAGK